MDPADFSRALAKNISEIYNNRSKVSPDSMYSVENKPGELMLQAVEKSKGVIGSSTCVMCMLDSSDAKVHTANLGDSSYMWLRKSGMDLERIYRAKE